LQTHAWMLPMLPRPDAVQPPLLQHPEVCFSCGPAGGETSSGSMSGSMDGFTKKVWSCSVDSWLSPARFGVAARACCSMWKPHPTVVAHVCQCGTLPPHRVSGCSSEIVKSPAMAKLMRENTALAQELLSTVVSRPGKKARTT